MSIARCAASLFCSLFVLGFSGAVAAEDSATARETPPAESGPPPAETERPATPAEPIATVPPIAAPAPVMPVTVVRPAQPTAQPPATPTLPLSLGRYGAIELGRRPSAASRWRGFPISLSLRDAPLPEVLRSFARIAGVNLVLAPGVTGSVTVELKDVPWDQALWVILKTHDLGAEIDGRVWSVAPD
jgi:type II secretory pathway component HofQ